MTDTHKLAQRDARSGSFEAAIRQTPPKTARLYDAIMLALAEHGPLSDPQLLVAVDIDCTPSGVRSRRNELVQAGWITELRDVDGLPIKRRNSKGSRCQVWRIVEPGETPPEPHRRVSELDRLRAELADRDRTIGELTTDKRRAHDHDAGLAAAQRFVTWNVGDPEIAGQVIDAYLDPEHAHELLDLDGAPRGN